MFRKNQEVLVPTLEMEIWRERRNTLCLNFANKAQKPEKFQSCFQSSDNKQIQTSDLQNKTLQELSITRPDNTFEWSSVRILFKLFTNLYVSADL